MEPRSYHDEWYLPDGGKHQGQLILDEKNAKIILEIFGQKFIEGTEIDMPRGRAIHHHDVILGGTSTITLYNCNFYGCRHIGKDLYKTMYLVEYVFNGYHFARKEDIKVKAATFIYPYLSTWYDGSTSHDKLEGQRGLFINGKEEVQSVLTNDTIEIDQNLSLILSDEVLKIMLDINRSYKTEYRKYLTIQYKNPVSFNQLLKDSITFRKLLEFSFGRPFKYEILDFHVYTPNGSRYQVYNDEYSLLNIDNYSLHNNEDIPTHVEAGYHILISRWNCTKEELDQITRLWYSNLKFHNIYEYYLDSDRWLGKSKSITNVMYNNRFLNLIQGLEDYYREMFKDDELETRRAKFNEQKAAVLNLLTSNSELKQWVNNNFTFSKHLSLRDKLVRILSGLEEDCTTFFYNIPLYDFPIKAKEYRDTLSHGKNKEIRLGDDFDIQYRIANILLGICILQSLGVSSIGKKVSKYIAYKDKRSDIMFLLRKMQDTI